MSRTNLALADAILCVHESMTVLMYRLLEINCDDDTSIAAKQHVEALAHMGREIVKEFQD